jgi:hypothetical protein
MPPPPPGASASARRERKRDDRSHSRRPNINQTLCSLLPRRPRAQRGAPRAISSFGPPLPCSRTEAEAAADQLKQGPPKPSGVSCSALSPAGAAPPERPTAEAYVTQGGGTKLRRRHDAVGIERQPLESVGEGRCNAGRSSRSRVGGAPSATRTGRALVCMGRPPQLGSQTKPVVAMEWRGSRARPRSPAAHVLPESGNTCSLTRALVAPVWAARQFAFTGCSNLSTECARLARASAPRHEAPITLEPRNPTVRVICAIDTPAAAAGPKGTPDEAQIFRDDCSGAAIKSEPDTRHACTHWRTT